VRVAVRISCFGIAKMASRKKIKRSKSKDAQSSGRRSHNGREREFKAEVELASAHIQKVVAEVQKQKVSLEVSPAVTFRVNS